MLLLVFFDEDHCYFVSIGMVKVRESNRGT